MSLRGADALVARSRAGVRRVFTLSGNHIMPVFDATFGPAWRCCTRATRRPRCTWPTPGQG